MKRDKIVMQRAALKYCNLTFSLRVLTLTNIALTNIAILEKHNFGIYGRNTFKRRLCEPFEIGHRIVVVLPELTGADVIVTMTPQRKNDPCHLK